MSWQYVAVATEAAVRAGAIQLEHYGQDVKVEKKGEIDLVTEVDHACEAAILEIIRSRFPEHDIVTEETDLARTGSSPERAALGRPVDDGDLRGREPADIDRRASHRALLARGCRSRRAIDLGCRAVRH